MQTNNSKESRQTALPMREYWSLLRQYLTPRLWWVLLLSVLVVVEIVFQLINPQIVSNFIDGALEGEGDPVLIRLAVYFLVFALLKQLAVLGSTYVGQHVAWGAMNEMRNDMMDHCLRLDLPFHNNHTPGEMIERIQGDIQQLGNFFSRMTTVVLANLLLMVGVLILMWKENWQLGLTLTVFLIAILVVLYLTRNIAVKSMHAERQARADLFGFIEERLAGMEDINGNDGRAYTLNRFTLLSRTLLDAAKRRSIMGNLFYVTGFLPFMVGITLAMGISAGLYQRGEISLGTVYLTFSYMTMMQRPLNILGFQIRNLQNATAGIWRIKELLGNTADVCEPDQPKALIAGAEKEPLAVKFEKVSFRYDDAPPPEMAAIAARQNEEALDEADDQALTLKEINFTLKPGHTLGLLGRTGSGKTTLIRLLCRLYDPVDGAIRIGYERDQMVDLRDLSFTDLRRDVGVITQQVQLFYASIRDNLTFFDRSISDERILEVIHELGVEDWFNSLPDGLDTRLETGSSGLSAGESQLLAFTRIFLKDPGLVILDEASSRIDPATEAMLERAMNRLMENRTAIVIAHRLATVQRADEIMVLSAGQVEEYGKRTALVDDPDSIFSNLLRTGMEEVLT